MRHSSILLIALAAQASAGHFYLEARLRDGKTVTGYVPEKRAAFEGVTVDGKPVTVRLARLPSYAKRPWSQSIQWDEKRNVFVLRAPSWTGELKRIWKELVLDPKPPPAATGSVAERELEAALDDQRRVTLRGSDVAEAKIRWIDPAKEAIKPTKRK
jgi:hypothetical protein